MHIVEEADDKAPDTAFAKLPFESRPILAIQYVH